MSIEDMMLQMESLGAIREVRKWLLPEHPVPCSSSDGRVLPRSRTQIRCLLGNEIFQEAQLDFRHEEVSCACL